MVALPVRSRSAREPARVHTPPQVSPPQSLCRATSSHRLRTLGFWELLTLSPVQLFSTALIITEPAAPRCTPLAVARRPCAGCHRMGIDGTARTQRGSRVLAPCEGAEDWVGPTFREGFSMSTVTVACQEMCARSCQGRQPGGQRSLPSLGEWRKKEPDTSRDSDAPHRKRRSVTQALRLAIGSAPASVDS